MRRTADQLADMVLQISKMDKAELGDSVGTQKIWVYDFMSLAMHKLAKIANQVRYSDPLTLSGGEAVFKQNGASLAGDLFQPIAIISESTGVEARRRQTYGSSDGWFWEGDGSVIHTRGITGDHVLHYIKYPAWITSGTQTPEFPPSGYYTLVFEAASLIKQSKNFYEESNAMLGLATKHLPNALSANLIHGNSSANPVGPGDLGG